MTGLFTPGQLPLQPRQSLLGEAIVRLAQTEQWVEGVRKSPYLVHDQVVLAVVSCPEHIRLCLLSVEVMCLNEFISERRGVALVYTLAVCMKLAHTVHQVIASFANLEKVLLPLVLAHLLDIHLESRMPVEHEMAQTDSRMSFGVLHRKQCLLFVVLLGVTLEHILLVRIKSLQGTCNNAYL